MKNKALMSASMMLIASRALAAFNEQSASDTYAIAEEFDAFVKPVQ